MKVVSESTLAELLGQDSHSKYWLVLEEQGHTLPALYKLMPSPEYEWLFLETPYAGFLKRSPVVLRLDDSTEKVFQAFANDPRRGIAPGIIVASQQTEAAVMAHLRHCLEVNFYGNRKGMLRYYHPDIAAVLFGPSVQVNPQWFGPLERWIWHGEELWHSNPDRPYWHALCLDDTERKGSPSPIQLTQQQEAALEKHIRLRRAWEAYRHPGDSFDNAETRKRFLDSFHQDQANAISSPQGPDKRMDQSSQWSAT